MITLRSYPMPPSVNELYFNNLYNGGRGRIKSQSYKQFERAVSIWAMQNQATLMQARDLTTRLNAKNVLRIDSVFYFYERKILMKADGKEPVNGFRAKKKGEPKASDTSNRLKAMEDTLCALLGIDDCWIWAGSFTKAPFPESPIPEHVNISISLYEVDWSK
jgi:hypothetical protein